MTPGAKRDRARYIRQIAQGLDRAAAQTLRLLAAELEAQAAEAEARLSAQETSERLDRMNRTRDR